MVGRKRFIVNVRIHVNYLAIDLEAIPSSIGCDIDIFIHGTLNVKNVSLLVSVPLLGQIRYILLP